MALQACVCSNPGAMVQICQADHGFDADRRLDFGNVDKSIFEMEYSDVLFCLIHCCNESAAPP